MFASGSRSPLDRALTSEHRVGLFVDFNDLRRALDEQMPDVAVQTLAQRLRELAEEHGRVLLSIAYGDWSASPDQARELRRQQIEPRMVLDREADDDHTEVVLSLDVQETLFVGPDIDTFVLVAADHGYPELLSRLRRADKRTVQVGLEPHDAFVARGSDRYVTIEEVLKGRRGRVASRVELTSSDWIPFIKLMNELEANMPFVGFGWLLKKKLSADNCGCASAQDKQDLMDRAVDDGLLELYKVDNIDEGADPVTACRLNREHAVVKEHIAE